MRGHGVAVSPGVQDSKKVAGLRELHRAVPCEDVAGLADVAGDGHGNSAAAARPDGDDLVVGAVHGGTDEVVESGVDADEGVRGCLFDIGYRNEKHPSFGDEVSARLHGEGDRAAVALLECVETLLQFYSERGEIEARFARLVRYADAAADVDGAEMGELERAL